MPTHLYLSPHLDDAVLSAGGRMYRQIALGHRVVIATFCTLDSSSQYPLSPLARAVHEKWGNPVAPYALRREQDVKACGLLGAEWRHLGFADAIYRRGPRESDCYGTFESLFGAIPTWDSELCAAMAAEIERLVVELDPADVFGPLGVGSNIDHCHVLHALWQIRGQIRSAALYEEQPYATGRYPTARRDPVAEAVRRCPFVPKPEIQEIDFEGKRRAIMCYESQLSELFGRKLKGLAEIEGYGRSLLQTGRVAERVWAVLVVLASKDSNRVTARAYRGIA